MWEHQTGHDHDEGDGNDDDGDDDGNEVGGYYYGTRYSPPGKHVAGYDLELFFITNHDDKSKHLKGRSGPCVGWCVTFLNQNGHLPTIQLA